MKKNILITAIGSMSTEEVTKSLSRHGYNLFGTDIYPAELTGTVHLFKKVYQVPLTSSKDYIPTLLKICKESKIDFIIPLIDVEVDIFSKNRKIFENEGVIITIPPEKCVELCRNKNKFYEFFKNHPEIKCIPTYTYNEIQKKKIPFPLIAKIINGRSSEGLFFIENIELFNSFKNKKEKYIFQPYIKGDIMTVDCVRDFDGNDFSVCRKEILRTKNGAGLAVKIKEISELKHLVSIIVERLGVLGAINIEFLYDGKNYYLMDINPRFSAGLGFSQLTGYDFVMNHLKSFQNKIIDTGANYSAINAVKRYQTIITKG